MSHFLQYSNETQSNVIPRDDFGQLILEVFNVVKDTVARSFGPLGSSTTILERGYNSATKDGYAILSSLVFHNRYKKLAHDLIMEPCISLNNTVGDGTTTSMMISGELYKLLSEQFVSSPDGTRNMTGRQFLEQYYMMPRQFDAALDDVVSDICEKIESYATPIKEFDYDTIYQLAYVSSNGNETISHEIASVYKECSNPTIKKQTSPTSSSYIKRVDGFSIDTRLIDPRYARNDEITVNVDRAIVLMFDHTITMEVLEQVIVPIYDVLTSMDHKIVVLAPAYDSVALNGTIRNILESNLRQHGEPLMFISKYSKLNDYELSDLAALLQCEVITGDRVIKFHEKFNSMSDGEKGDYVIELLNSQPTDGSGIIGSCKSASVAYSSASIFAFDNQDNNERYQSLLNEVENELANESKHTGYFQKSYSQRLAGLRNRIAQLKMHNYIYYVGAASNLEKKILEDSIDDVIKCTKSAVKHGIVPGCQLSVIRAANNVMNEYMSAYRADDTTDPSRIQIANGIMINEVPNDVFLRYHIADFINLTVQRVYSAVLDGPDKCGISKMIIGWNEMSKDEQVTWRNNKLVQIVTDSIECNKVYDISRAEFNDTIITSCETDTMVLSAAIKLMKILISGNQCLYVDPTKNGSHEDNMDLPV